MKMSKAASFKRKPSNIASKTEKTAETERNDNFHWKVWTFFTAENIILDFGRPIAMIYCHSDKWFPLNRPSVGDYFHMAYNVFTALAIFQLYNYTMKSNKQSKKDQQRSTIVVITLLCLFVMGASIHLVGDSVNHRLALLGYQHHLSLRENDLMKNLRPKELVECFDLLYYFDEHFGHILWYIPLFLLQFLYFTRCFYNKKQEPLRISHYLLIFLSGLYHWYLGTEGQITPLLIAFYVSMQAGRAYRQSQGQHLDLNGKFLLNSIGMALALTMVWVVFLWEEPEMRRKYPGWFYVPEPWAYYSLKWGVA